MKKNLGGTSKTDCQQEEDQGLISFRKWEEMVSGKLRGWGKKEKSSQNNGKERDRGGKKAPRTFINTEMPEKSTGKL